MNHQLLRCLRLAALSVLSLSLFAQSTESIPFRLNLSPLNEVPAITDLNARGWSTVWLHVVRNAQGQVVSGSVDFTVRYQFPGETSFTGLHIHRGAAGTNGPVVIDTGILGTAPLVDPEGRGEIFRQAPVRPGSAGVAVLNEILADPENFYVNLHTTVHRGGAIRGQLQRTEFRTYGVELNPRNEVPAVMNSRASGIAFLTLLAGVNDQGVLQSAEVTFDVNYMGFAEGTHFTGMHIHQGPRGMNGPVTVDTGLTRAQNIFAGAGGGGNLRYVTDVNVTSANSVNTIYTMLTNPDGTYLNLHSDAFPGGEIRGPLRSTELIQFSSLNMLPQNEVPPVTNLDAQGQGAFSVSLMRAPNGEALAGYTIFDVNYAFPGATTFTGLHIHREAAGANGPVVLDSGIRTGSLVVSEGGFGNIYRRAIAMTPAQLAALNALLANPRNFYINLHTTAHPPGAVRAQLMDSPLAPPRIDNVITSVSDPSRTTLAQGGLMTIYGRNLSAISGTLDGWEGMRAPEELNGVSVSIEGRPAPVLEVKPGSIIAQVPFETSASMVELSAKTPGGTSNTLRANVARIAPALFFDQINTDGMRAVAYDLESGKLINQENPGAMGMTVAVFGTGFGQSTPALRTGQVADDRVLARFPDVRVSIGGRPTGSAITVLIPGLVGITQTIFRLPDARGAAALDLEFMGVRANRVVVYMR
jgi:uncharacterized protein (TIGR03437 family)